MGAPPDDAPFYDTCWHPEGMGPSDLKLAFLDAPPGKQVADVSLLVSGWLKHALMHFMSQQVHELYEFRLTLGVYLSGSMAICQHDYQ